MDTRKMIKDGATPKEIESQLLTLGSEFRFKCRKCGKCCKNQDTILFNLRDVFNIAKALSKTPEDVINEYTEVYLGSGSHIPVVHKEQLESMSDKSPKDRFGTDINHSRTK